MTILLYIFVLVTFSVKIMAQEFVFLQQMVINQINLRDKSWMDSVNTSANASEKYLVNPLVLKREQTSYQLNSSEEIVIKSDDDAYIHLYEIPKFFDAREQWNHCRTIGKVRYQGCCRSNWAMSVVDAFADRLCVATGDQFELSTEDVVLCCKDCWYHDESGCLGGEAIQAWKYLKEYGVVTGGEYNTTHGCAPYTVGRCPKSRNWNATCPKTCYGNSNINFINDKKNTKDYYYLTFDAIRKDIMTYGPIVATINIHNDYYSYKSGVYIKSEDSEYHGERVVKLIGWGVENGTPYWLCLESRGKHWGENGLIKIRRGTNELNIENSASAGIPLAAVRQKYMKSIF